MLIRHADATRDASSCGAIYAPFVSATAISFEEDPPDEHEMARRITRVTSTHPWLVAEDRGSLRGFAYASAHRQRAAYRWTTEVTVYVSPDHHGRGIGRALYAELLRHVTDQGFHLACAGVTLPNQASIGLHQALGFTEVGVFRQIGFKFGAWHDVAWFQKELQAPGSSPPEPRRPDIR